MGCGVSKFDPEEALAPNNRINPLRRRIEDIRRYHYQHHRKNNERGRDGASSSSEGGNLSTKQLLVEAETDADILPHYDRTPKQDNVHAAKSDVDNTNDNNNGRGSVSSSSSPRRRDDQNLANNPRVHENEEEDQKLGKPAEEEEGKEDLALTKYGAGNGSVWSWDTRLPGTDSRSSFANNNKENGQRYSDDDKKTRTRDKSAVEHEQGNIGEAKNDDDDDDDVEKEEEEEEVDEEKEERMLTWPASPSFREYCVDYASSSHSSNAPGLPPFSILTPLLTIFL